MELHRAPSDRLPLACEIGGREHNERNGFPAVTLFVVQRSEHLRCLKLHDSLEELLRCPPAPCSAGEVCELARTEGCRSIVQAAPIFSEATPGFRNLQEDRLKHFIREYRWLPELWVDEHCDGLLARVGKREFPTSALRLLRVEAEQRTLKLEDVDLFHEPLVQLKVV